MPHYHTAGAIPHKRHTQFRKPDGSLYSEQLFSTEGFSNDYSLLYHTHPPTQIIRADEPVNVMPEIAEEKMLKHRSLEGFNIKPQKDFLQSRKAVLVTTIAISYWQRRRKAWRIISIKMQMQMN
jgi:homogentisate 1,2-dioxygenase